MTIKSIKLGKSRLIFNDATILKATGKSSANNDMTKDIIRVMEVLVDEFANEVLNSETISIISQTPFFIGLYGFEGGESGFDDAVNTLINFIENEGKKTIKVRNVGGRWNISVFGPDFTRSMYEQTPFEWDSDISWAEVTQKGMRQNELVFIHTTGFGRSEEGFMRDKQDTIGRKTARFRATNFLTEALTAVFNDANVSKVMKQVLGAE